MGRVAAHVVDAHQGHGEHHRQAVGGGVGQQPGAQEPGQPAVRQRRERPARGAVQRALGADRRRVAAAGGAGRQAGAGHDGHGIGRQQQGGHHGQQQQRGAQREGAADVSQPDRAGEQQPHELPAAGAGLQRADLPVPGVLGRHLHDEHGAHRARGRDAEPDQRGRGHVPREPARQPVRQQRQPRERQPACQRQAVAAVPVAPGADEGGGHAGGGERGVGEPLRRAGGGGQRQDHRHHAALHQAEQDVARHPGRQGAGGSGHGRVRERSCRSLPRGRWCRKDGGRGRASPFLKNDD